MRIALVLAISVLAAGVLWLAGEQHRRNCMSTGNTRCSALPWDAGMTPRSSTSTTTRPTLTEQGCVQLTIRNATAVTTDQIQPMPPECR
ncbi:hypothetical protein [Candidatus Solirubrobacter pratensis]|uniref:hypothetical protein n=1 Tax=Candidatus Solirubrobacter pratensis TaxID=1298857 RepID=UPI00040AEE1C|nr:hypothetical protein [Candidatus Solirubrobacter pratensis]